MMGKVKMSLWVTIIAALLTIGIVNIFGMSEKLTLGQLIRICSLLSGAIIGSSIYAVCAINKLDRESQ